MVLHLSKSRRCKSSQLRNDSFTHDFGYARRPPDLRSGFTAFIAMTAQSRGNSFSSDDRVRGKESWLLTRIVHAVQSIPKLFSISHRITLYASHRLIVAEYISRAFRDLSQLECDVIHLMWSVR